jgi:RNA polymerase sigma-70 factor, ECF subfamily
MRPHIAPGMTDAELVSAVRAGQTDALGRLFDRYAEPTWRLLSRMLGSPADADDALQDVFIGLPEILASYSGRAPLGAWIRGVAVNTALMRLRTDRRRAEDPLDELDAVTGTVSRPPEAIEDRITIAAALHSLPEVLRIVFVLKEVSGYSHAEIAQTLGISVSLSEIRLFRARKLLRSIVGVAP